MLLQSPLRFRRLLSEGRSPFEANSHHWSRATRMSCSTITRKSGSDPENLRWKTPTLEWTANSSKRLALSSFITTPHQQTKQDSEQDSESLIIFTLRRRLLNCGLLAV